MSIKFSVLTVIVGGAQRVLIRPLADTVGGNGSAPLALLVPEVPVHTYASTTSMVLKPAFQGIKLVWYTYASNTSMVPAAKTSISGQMV